MTAPWIEVLQKFVPAEIAGHDLQTMFYNSINASRRDLSIFVFTNRQAQPRWVIRCHHDRDIVQRQFTALQALERAQCDCQPVALGETTFDDLYALLLRFCEGKPFSPDMILKNRVELDRVMATLVQIQSALANGVSQQMTAHAQITLADLQRQNDLDSEALRLRLEHAVDLIQQLRLPMLPQHSDFVWANLLHDRRRVIIIDWEHVAFLSLPFFDVWTLLLSLLHNFSVESFQQLFHPSPLSATAIYALQNYAQKLGIPVSPARDLFPLALVGFIALNKRQNRNFLAGKLTRLLEFYLANADTFLPGDLH